MPDHLRRMPVPSKVHSFQAEVGGDECLMATGNAKNRAVIANAERDCRISMSAAADRPNQRFFTQRQSATNIAEPDRPPGNRALGPPIYQGLCAGRRGRAICTPPPESAS